jgi:hypothetical protein
VSGRRVGRFGAGALAVLVAACVVSGAAASPGIVIASDEPELVVSPGDELIGSLISIVPPANQPLPDSVVLSVPVGYTLDLPAPRAAAGVLSLSLHDRNASLSFTDVTGDLVAQDPSQYAADACDPGPHAGVWLLSTSVAGSPLSVPVFVDVPTDGSAAYTLRLCPGEAFGTASSPSLDRLVLVLASGPNAPSAAGVYTWSALVTPPGGPAAELRAVLALPQRLTLAARYDAKRRMATLAGTYSVQGKPRAGATISLDVITHNGDKSTDRLDVAQTRTSATGAFTFRAAVKVTSFFRASVQPTADPCEGASPAPGGCLSSTTIGPDPAGARVQIRRASDPRFAPSPADQKRAARIGLTLADLPAGWEAQADIDESCDQPKESDLTISGESSSEFYDLAGDPSTPQIAYAESHVRLFTSAQAARTAFQRETARGAIGCLLRELPEAAHPTLRPRSLPRLGPDVRAFRITVSFQGQSATLDSVFLRRGRALCRLDVSSLNTPTTLTDALVRKIAARMR